MLFVEQSSQLLLAVVFLDHQNTCHNSMYLQIFYFAGSGGTSVTVDHPAVGGGNYMPSEVSVHR